MTREREIVRRMDSIRFVRHTRPDVALMYARMAREQLLRLIHDLEWDIEAREDREARQ